MTLKQGESEVDLPYHEDVVIVNPDDLLPPVVKLEKYASNDIVYNRQAVVRNLLETLRGSIGKQDEIDRIVTVMCSLAQDYEPSVRAELMEQVPQLAALCNENSSELGHLIEQHLLPLIIQFLGDTNNQVRKRSHTALLVLVEKSLIDDAYLEENICPLVLQMTEDGHLDDHRTEAITLMSKLSPLVGKEKTERLFLEPFAALCLDSSFHVRKMCASCFGDFCGVVGREATESKLLGEFFTLCEDGVWGVRKACAEVFMPVSCICSMDTRHKELAPLYMRLLCDQSRWVRMAAFQALGPFISTFAEPYKTGLYYSKDGILTVVDITGNSTHTRGSGESASSEEDLLNTSLNDRDSSSICRTNIVSSEQCDITVPLYHAENGSSTQTLNETYHSNTYCSVIEVNSLCSDSVAVKDSIRDINNIFSAEEGIMLDEKLNRGSAVTEINSPSHTVQEISNHVETTEDDNLWHQCLYANVATEVTISNGEIIDEVKVHNSSSLLHKEIKNSDESDLHVTEINKNILTNRVGLGHTKKTEVIVNGVPVHSTRKWEISPGSLGLAEVGAVDLLCDSHMYIIDHSAHVNGIINEKSSESTVCAGESMVNSVHSTQSSLLEENLCNHVPDVAEFFPDLPEIANHSKQDSDIPNIERPCDSQGDDESAFNHFQYWRTPIPDVDIDIKAEESQDSGSHFGAMPCDIKTSVQAVSSNTGLSKIRDVPITSWSSLNSSNYSVAGMKNIQDYDSTPINKIERLDFTGHHDDDANYGCKLNRTFTETLHCDYDKSGEPAPTSQQYISAHDQDIVPPDLLLRYLSMTDASRAQTVDAEIARHCAYSLPAVALTLGRKYWPCLKETYNTLASDMQGFIMQWKVRRTLASSMHQLAVILGPDISAKDLLPVFSGFVKDLDEVRIGILQHLSEFLVVLHTKGRKQFLPRISEFLNTGNEKNWRFRLILAEQLIPTAELYDPDDVRNYLVPLTLTLVHDKVCEVRLVAAQVMAAMMKRMSQSATPVHTKSVLTELAEQFIHAPKWSYRQVYVYMCQEFIKNDSLPADQFGEDALPHLLFLCWDRVPNVRLAVARCLAVYVWPLENFSHPESPHRDLLLQALHTLQSDLDSDVQHFANMVATDDCSCLQHSALKDMDDPPV